MGKVEGVNVILKELIISVNLCCAKVYSKGRRVVVLADTVFNVVGGEVLQGWVYKE